MSRLVKESLTTLPARFEARRRVKERRVGPRWLVVPKAKKGMGVDG
jgi:hypothetical protein